VIFKWIARTVALVLFAAGMLGLAAYYYPEKFLSVDHGPVVGDVIVVLGGGYRGERAERAAELFRRGDAPRILITGFGDDEINRRALLQHGVPASAIEVENQSKTTQENALFTTKRLREEKAQRIILVTSWYHSRRALKTFEHAAPDLTFYSRPSYFGFDRDEWTQHDNARRMRLEFLKLPGYWFWYGVNPF